MILLVEDNESDELLTIRAFKRANTANVVLVVRDGAEALDCVFRTGACENTPTALPAVMLLDLNLPKVSGLEVLRRIRADERTNLLPVVVLTGSREEEDIVPELRVEGQCLCAQAGRFWRIHESRRNAWAFLVLDERNPGWPRGFAGPQITRKHRMPAVRLEARSRCPSAVL